jgi:hypothetical protein
MTELKERFSLAEEIDTRDLWDEARRRAASPEVPPRRQEWPPGTGRRLVAVAVAFAVFATAAIFAWDLSHPDPRPGPAIERPSVDLAEDLGPGWSELPPPPEVRTNAATAWTGSQLVIWGGYVFDGGGDKTPNDDGFMFDAGSRTWGPMPAGPLSPRSDAASAWSGSEFLIWGGFTGDCCVPSEMFLDDGAAFDPATGRWRALPASPLGERAPFSVWTGRELIVWGSRDRTVRRLDGAAYDPDTSRWRPIADGPIELTDGSAVWTGEEMIVFGAALDGNNHAGTETNIGAAYNPTTDTWRRIQDSTLSPQAVTATWPGSGEMIAWDYEQATAAYDPRSDTWRDLPQVPLQFAECHPRSVAIPGQVFGDFCGGSVTFSVAEDRWEKIRRDEIRGWVTEPVAAGSAFLVMAHPLELSDEPGVTFDTKMFAYVPPGTDAASRETDPAPFVPATEMGGDEIRMPVTFPDGSTGTLVYPRELALAEMGVQPDVTYSFRERYQGPIVFLHDRDASIRRFVERTEPVAIVNSDRRIEIWAARGNDVDARFWMRVSLPSWTVLVPLEEQGLAEQVATSLDVRETADGFPVVEASGSAALSEGFGEAGGAQLAFGDALAAPDMVSQLNAVIFLSPDGCSPTTEGPPYGGYGSSCLGGGTVFASIYGIHGFVPSVIEGLRVEDFRQA